MLSLINVLKGRLTSLQHASNHGAIPGELDTYELLELAGRAKELDFIIQLLETNHMNGEITTCPIII